LGGDCHGVLLSLANVHHVSETLMPSSRHSRGQRLKPTLEIAPSPEDLIEHVLQDIELRGLELENFTVRDVRSMVLQQLANYDFYECAPPTIELIDPIVTEYLGAEKISGADSYSRALEISPCQNSKASGRRGTVRRA
jgi:hypothetical protein